MVKFQNLKKNIVYTELNANKNMNKQTLLFSNMKIPLDDIKT